MGLLSDLAQRFENGLGTLREFTELPARMAAAEERIEIMSLNQQYLNDVTTELEQLDTALDTRISELEAQAAEGVPLDFTRLRAVKDHLTVLTSSVPDPETPLPEAPPVVTNPEAPVDPSAPVEDLPPVDGGF